MNWRRMADLWRSPPHPWRRAIPMIFTSRRKRRTTALMH